MPRSISENTATLTKELWGQHFAIIDFKKGPCCSWVTRSATHFYAKKTNRFINTKLTSTGATVWSSLFLHQQYRANQHWHWSGISWDWEHCHCEVVGTRKSHAPWEEAKTQRSIELDPHPSQFCKSGINKCWFCSPTPAHKRDIFPAHRIKRPWLVWLNLEYCQ